MKHGRLTRLALFASADCSDWREVSEMAGRRDATNTKPEPVSMQVVAMP